MKKIIIICLAFILAYSRPYGNLYWKYNNQFTDNKEDAMRVEITDAYKWQNIIDKNNKRKMGSISIIKEK